MSKIIRSFADLLAACKQDCVKTKKFNEERYPLEPIAVDETEWEVYVHYFDKKIDGSKAFEKLEKLGYRLLGGSRRAMEFIAKNPNIQLKHPLIITARWQNSHGEWFAPFFYQILGRRRLAGHCLLKGDFIKGYGWLVLRKK